MEHTKGKASVSINEANGSARIAVPAKIRDEFNLTNKDSLDVCVRENDGVREIVFRRGV